MPSERQSFALFRIIGNSLPPRHAADNVVKSTQYILDHEEDFDGCEKLWVLNRIVNVQHKQQIVDLLVRKQHRFIDIPFDAEDHFNSFLDVTGAPISLRFALKEQTTAHHVAVKFEEWRTRHKSQRLVGINEARNLALKAGRAGYDWSIIGDGGIIFTRQGWDQFVQSVSRAPTGQIAVIPMHRVHEWKPLADYAPNDIQEEPQLAFHRTSQEEFDPSLRYGNLNKAELLVRLGVPGPWQDWRPVPWEARHPMPAPNFGKSVVAGFVYRLPTDGAGEEVDRSRFADRFRGLQAFSFLIDLSIAYHRRNQTAELVPSYPKIADDRSRTSIRAFIDTLLAEPDAFMTDKRATAPSGNVHDYVSQAPYFSSAGLRYDGHPRDEAEERAGGDSGAFRAFAWRVYAFAIGGVLLEQPHLVKRADDLLRSWFADPETRMNPSIRYAQMIPLRSGINEIGVVELRQLANVVRAVKFLESRGALGPDLIQLIKEWSQQFLDDCEKNGIREKSLRCINNIGTWAAVLFGTLDLFCGRYSGAFSIAHQSSERLGRQLGPFSVQLNEISRTKPLHYCLFNLAAWFNLSRFCEEFGINIFRFHGVHDESLPNALEFCAANRRQYSDYASDAAEYDARIETLRFMYKEQGKRSVLLVPEPHWGLPPIICC